MKQHFYLIDALAFAFRAYHAIRANLTDAQNRPTNAVYGFTRILLKLLREQDPDYIAVVFDAPEKNFREEMYPDYKATRVKAPPELLEQIPRMHEVARALNLPVLVVPGVEADDVIGTLSRKAVATGLEVVLVSGDKDLMQLIGDQVRMFDPGKDSDQAWTGKENVVARFGVGPDNVRDALALIGDSADNVPGVRQIGEVKARKLLKQYTTLENLYAHLDDITGKQREYLEHDRDQAFFSRELVTLKTDVPLDIAIEDCTRRPWDTEELTACFEALSFHKLLDELIPGQHAPTIATTYHCVDSEIALKELVAALRTCTPVALQVFASDALPMRARLAGISLCAEPGYAWYIPLLQQATDLEALMENPERTTVGFSADTALKHIKPLLEDDTVKKYCHDLKYGIILLRRVGITLRGVVMDTMIASYLTDASRLGHNVDELSLHFLNHKTIPVSDILGKGSKAISFDHVSPDTITPYACEVADMIRRLADVVAPLLERDGLDALFTDVELPLSHVLANMEMRGVAIDVNLFKQLQEEIVAKLTILESTIQELAGDSFNINSPKQLQRILFDKIGLKPVRKTKSGYSTDVDALEALASKHPLPCKILEYRTLEKLRGTYVEALPKLVHPDTGRIHTSFNQAVTATGRLSSSHPNMQNIPTRTELGKRIRQGFVASADTMRLIAADYSQIELRILAHLSGDTTLREAFERNADIHRDTAARVFAVSPDAVTPEMRRQAKAVNFGVIYGISDFGLARNLGIAKTDAKQFIDQYFRTYPDVARWLTSIKEHAKRDGYVTTLFNRRRYITDINSSNAAARGAAERMAINMPVQGASADIIKIAMTRLHEALAPFAAHLLMQVHDELVVEAPTQHAEAVAALMKEVMENAVKLETALTVDIGIGTHWAEIH